MSNFATVSDGSAPIGLGGAIVRPIMKVGSDVEQPTPLTSNVYGYASDADFTVSPPNFITPVQTLPPAVSSAGFEKPMIKRTTSPYSWFSDIFAAFRGLLNKTILTWFKVDPIPIQQDTQPKGASTFMDYQQQTQTKSSKYDAFDGITFPKVDIGNTQMKDRYETFNTFAGGLDRVLGGQVVNTLDWKRGLDKSRQGSAGNLVEMKTNWNDNFTNWLKDYPELLPPISSQKRGAGFNAFGAGMPSVTGATPPVQKKWRLF